MLNKKPIRIGLISASVAYYAESAYWFPAGLVNFLGTVAGLQRPARVETGALWRFLARAPLFLFMVGAPSIAVAAQATEGGGGTVTVLSGLQQGLGLIMLIAVPTGVIMIIKAVLQHQSGDATWKMEILKGLIMMGAPVITNALFTLFLGGNGVQVTIPTF